MRERMASHLFRELLENKIKGAFFYRTRHLSDRIIILDWWRLYFDALERRQEFVGVDANLKQRAITNPISYNAP